MRQGWRRRRRKNVSGCRKKHVQKSWGRADYATHLGHGKKSLELEGGYVRERLEAV